jgi:hypothetical protein
LSISTAAPKSSADVVVAFREGLSKTEYGIDIRDAADWLGDSSVHWHQIATIIRNG